MLSTLTQEQEDLLDRTAADWIHLAVGGETTVDEAALLGLWPRLYREILEVPVPDAGLKVVVCDGPESAEREARALCEGASVACAQGVGLGWLGGWVARYSVYRDASFGDVLPDNCYEAQRLDLVSAILRAGVWDSYLLDEGVVVVRRPQRVSYDAQGGLHADGHEPAALWLDGTVLYAHHDVVVPDDLWLAPEDAVPTRWADVSTEVVRAVAERVGWARYLAIRGATLRDAWQDPTTGLHYELYDGGAYGLLRKESPKLKDGSQPWYCEPVPPECRTAAGARRWQVPEPDDRILSPEEAETRAEALQYKREA